MIRTAERMGIAIPRFCDHPLLAPAGACRQCLVDVEGQRKPVASCTQPVADGMVVKTHLTSPVAAKAQAGVMVRLSGLDEEKDLLGLRALRWARGPAVDSRGTHGVHECAVHPGVVCRDGLQASFSRQSGNHRRHRHGKHRQG